MRTLRSITALRALPPAVVAAAALALAPAAAANTSQSSNWAGYAVHKSKVTFRRVVGTWIEPAATCTPGVPTYSSLWVGIGGYSVSSDALEQIGTEVDCSASGRTVSSAWYELVPAASHTIRLKVNPGDRVRAQVTVVGKTVALTLEDQTRHTTFHTTVKASVVDTTSAEWIVEAPSICDGSYACHTLPLADFGSTGFTGATAESTTGHTGPIDDRHWTATRITLSAEGHRFIGGGGTASGAPTATPSALTHGGTTFAVAYAGAPVTAAPPYAAQVSSARLVR